MSETLLSSDVKYEDWKKHDGDGENCKRHWCHEFGCSARENGEDIGEHSWGGAEKEDADPVDFGLQSLAYGRK